MISVTVTTSTRSEQFTGPNIRVRSSGAMLLISQGHKVLGVYFWPLALDYRAFNGDDAAPF